MTEHSTRALLVGLSLMVGVAAGGVFVDASARLREVAADLVTPLADLRIERERQEATRTELKQIAELQARVYRETGTYGSSADLMGRRSDFTMGTRLLPGRLAWMREEWIDPNATPRPPRRIGDGWVAILSHQNGHYPEACAVALNLEGVYFMEGIALKRSGQVRCTWDVATILNTWVMLGVPPW